WRDKKDLLREVFFLPETMTIHLCKPHQNCRSWLACDSGVSVTSRLTEPPLSQASQLLQFDWVFSGNI
ncbi:MAG: hypothetical protein RR517_33625, partial [Pseudomonas sp.]